jgi:hypothetical protein
MDRRNTLYYAAAAGTVLVFIIALVGLATCSGSNGNGVTPEEQAMVNAYQQGYVDGYSKGYSDGFSSGMTSKVAQSTTGTVSSSRGCTVVTPITNSVFEDAPEES